MASWAERDYDEDEIRQLRKQVADLPNAPESGLQRERMARLDELYRRQEADAYETNDPKHPDFVDSIVDHWDMREKGE